jgi:U32 family peptidase
MKRRNRPEIVAPAGNPDKLDAAIRYGASTVYFGAEEFNLRNKSENFSREELIAAREKCADAGVKSVFLMNAFLRESDISAARELVRFVAKTGFNAVMVSDPGMLSLAREEAPDTDIHISTQMSVQNSLTFRFWESQGVKRIVLARECTLDDIRMIRDQTSAEIEIFAHGALCISYSGRCLLSRYMSGMDANRGECNHPCRWRYKLIEEKRPGEEFEILQHEGGTEILSSKDLCLLPRIGEYIEAGVDAFKIEGRMKSVYYAANVTRVYADAVRLYCETGSIEERLPFYLEELDMISHRPFTTDLFNEFPKGFHELPYIRKSDFIGVVTAASEDGAVIRTYNPIRPGDELEAIFPIQDGKIIDGYRTVRAILDAESPELQYELARPNSVYRLLLNEPVASGALLRKRLKE